MCDDIDPETIIYVKGRGQGDLHLHLTPDCPRLSAADTVNDRPRGHYSDDTPICDVCQNGVRPGSNGNSGPWEALQSADPDAVGGDVDQPNSPTAATRGGVADAN